MIYFTATIYKNIIYDYTPLNCVNGEPVCSFKLYSWEVNLVASQGYLSARDYVPYDGRALSEEVCTKFAVWEN